MRKIWTVDAFTSKAYAGNPAAVMIVDEFPQDMALIAMEMNLSETVFLKPLGENHFHIRWFTPAVEIKLCGHATLAASHILFQENKINGQTIHYESLSGPLTVDKLSDGLVLNFPLQKTTDILDKTIYAQALNLSEEIIEVVKAYDDVIVLVNHEDVVKNLVVNVNKLAEIHVRGVIITATSQQYDFISRFFGVDCGVHEDPVTGSAHCKLADFWSKRLNKTEFHAYQASKRGGELNIKIEQDRVLIKGQAVTIMEGQWMIAAP